MQKFLNLTKHPIKLNNGKVFLPSGILARLDTDVVLIDTIDDVDIFQTTYKSPVFTNTYGDEISISEDDNVLIVSGMMVKPLQEAGYRAFGPATSHKDVKRNDKGFVESVPGLTI